MPIERSEITAALLKKGFTQKSNDHQFYFFQHKNKVSPVFTKVSHGSKYKEIDDSFLSVMAKQLRLTKKGFKELVSCDMDYDKYVDHLKSMGVLKNSSS